MTDVHAIEDGLFPADEIASPSPRLQWMQRHDVSTEYRPSTDMESPWIAWTGSEACRGKLAFAATEAEALVDLARRNGWRITPQEAGL